MKLIKLHNGSDNIVLINPEHIVSISPNENVKGTKILFSNRETHYNIKETPEEIERIISGEENKMPVLPYKKV